MTLPTHLNRSLGLRLAIVLVIGNVIGSGVYKKVAPMAAELHSSGWILACWVLGGVITMFGALSNAEIASMKDFDAVLAKVERNKPINILFRRGDWVQYAVVRPGR